MIIHVKSTFESPVMYHVHWIGRHGGQEGLMLHDRTIGFCGGSSYVYAEPHWNGPPSSRRVCSVPLDGLLDEFLKQLKGCIPVLQRHFPVSASWELTPLEREVLDTFNREFREQFVLPISESLLVHQQRGLSVHIKNGRFVVTHHRFDYEKRQWQHIATNEAPPLTAAQVAEAMDEFHRRNALVV